MSWGGGGDIAMDMITSLCKWVPVKTVRSGIYEDLIKSLESQDWDCVEEVMGRDPVFDEVVESLYPREDYEE